MVGKMKASERIRSEIERRIARGAYADGDKLNEIALAEAFAVSRTPLREALQALSADGLVQLVPNRGAFVRRPSVARLVEMFEVMAELEAWCVMRAARRMTTAQWLTLHQAEAECQAALDADRPDDYYEANERLHGVLYDASGNEVLAEEARRMLRRLRPFRREQLNLSGRPLQSMQEHRQILDAIERGEAGEAAQLMRDHIRIGIFDRVLEVLRVPMPDQAK